MRKINNWADYNKLVKEEIYNVAKIEDTYIYQLETEFREANENTTWWRNRFYAAVAAKDALQKSTTD